MMNVLLVALALAAGDDAAQVKAVQGALAAAEPKLHRCWEQAAAENWNVEGRVGVRAVVGVAGRIERVEVEGGALRRPELVACVRDAFAGLDLGTAFAPGDSVELPVEFKAEPNVTLKKDDAPVLKVPGSQATARILIDKQTAGATKASLTWVELKPSVRWTPPCCSSTAVVVVTKGRAKALGGEAVTVGDAVVYPAESRSPELMASMRTELLVLLTPPGEEQAYRTGKYVTAIGAGKPTPARVYNAQHLEKRPILDGKGDVVMIVDDEKAAYTGRIHLDPGATVPEHAHADEAEIIYVLEGGGDMTIDGEKYPVTPFTAVYVPPGAKHSFTATRQTVAVQFYAPSGPEKRFKK
jgi:quercetin dioxygenase-like cupin family protein